MNTPEKALKKAKEKYPKGKVCSKCKKRKALSSFGVRYNLYKGQKKYALQSPCKKCRSIATMEWIKQNPKKFRKNLKRYHDRRREVYNKFKDQM